MLETLIYQYTRSQQLASSTGKFETLGSNFSQETRRGYWRPTLHQTKSNSFPLVGGTSARTFRLVRLIQHDSPVQQSHPYPTRKSYPHEQS